MIKEPTIHQIEELLKAFRSQGGTDAEISALAQDIIRDFRPETIRPVHEVFPKEKHKSIEKIVEFKESPVKPIKQAASDIWDKWYVKYPIIFLATFSVIFIVVNLPLYLAKSKPVTNTKKETVSNTRSVVETSAPLEPGEVIAASPTLVVPKIGVTAPIVFVQSTEEAQIQEGLHQGVVHYFTTALPGKVGNTFITGHSSNYWWDKGAYNYIFANLEKLEVGDQAKIYYNGNKYLYQVNNKKVVEATDMSVLNQTIKPSLTLMTCTPPGTSWKRLIITFDQIAPVYKATLANKNPSKSTSQTSLPKSDSNPFVDFIGRLFGFNK